MRDKRTSIPSLDAGPLPERPEISDGFVYRDCALEVRRIGLHLAHECHQSRHLFWSDCGYALVKCPDVSISKTGIRTIVKVAHLHRSRADTKEEHTVFLVLCVELGHNDIQGRLGGSIQRSYLNLVIVDKVKVAMTAGNGDDLLDLALHDKREEEVEEVDVADDIGLE